MVACLQAIERGKSCTVVVTFRGKIGGCTKVGFALQAKVSHVPVLSCTRFIRWVGRGATHAPVLPLQPMIVQETV
jgi:hypothetical protein